MADSDFTFVLSTANGHVAQPERLRVRSYCMKGKNKRHSSRRSVREAKRAARAEKSRDDDDGSPSTALIPATYVPPPSLLDGDLIAFAKDIDMTSREMLHQFLIYSRLKHEFYAVDSIVNFDTYRTDSSPWLLSDAAFLHSVIMSVSAMQDLFLRRPFSSTTLHHLRKTLALLNHRLSDGDSYKTDSTIWIILTLATISGLFHEFTATGTHIAGLRQIVLLRGGRRFLKRRPKMTFKLESVEFSSCLSCGKAPILWDLPITWSPIFSVTSTALIDIPPELSTDERLLSVLGDLREIVALVNCHAIMKSRLDGNIFQAAMSSVRYRLLFLLEDEDVRGSTCECLCLGMLAFLTTTLAIPGRRVSYPYFADRVRGANWNEDIAASSTTCYVHMWLLLVCAMTVLHVDGEDQEWLRRLWLRIWMPDMKWNALQRRISDIAWLPKIHDRSGWEVFVALSAQTDGSEQLGQALGGLESKS